MPLNITLGRQKQANSCDFSLVYRANSRAGRTVAQRSPVFKKKKRPAHININTHTSHACMHTLTHTSLKWKAISCPNYEETGYIVLSF